MNTYIENDTELVLTNFLNIYPIDEFKGNFDDFSLNSLDGQDLFGEIDNDRNNILSEKKCIDDFDLNMLNTDINQYIMPIDYQVKIETDRFYAGQFTVDSHWQMSANVPALNVNIYSPAASPCYSEASTSSSLSFSSVSSCGPQIRSKRGRKPKDWDNSNVINSMISSAKNTDELNKTKNNISSGKYRKRKAMERKELDNKIALLEIRNQKLNEKIQKNKLWFDSVRTLFPDITLPW